MPWNPPHHVHQVSEIRGVDVIVTVIVLLVIVPRTLAWVLPRSQAIGR